MYGDDEAINFVFRNKDIAKNATNWDSFCDQAKARGEKLADYYRDFKWLPQFYRTAKHNQKIKYLPKALYMPEATNLNAIFTGLVYRESKSSELIGGHFVGCPLNNSLGTHTYDAKRDVATLHKAKWYALYATRLTKECSAALDNAGMMEGPGSFDCIKWPDGEYLVICRDQSGIGERWLCLLPADYDFTQHISQEARDMIAASEASFAEAIKDAPATSMYKTRHSNH